MTGVYTATSDGTWNPHTVTLAPGSIIPVGSNSNQNPSLKALESSGNPQLGDVIIDAAARKALSNQHRGERRCDAADGEQVDDNGPRASRQLQQRHVPRCGGVWNCDAR